MASAAVVDLGAGSVDRLDGVDDEEQEVSGATPSRRLVGRSIGVSRSIVTKNSIIIGLSAIRSNYRLSPAGCQQVFSFEAALNFLVSHLAPCKLTPVGRVAVNAFQSFNERHT